MNLNNYAYQVHAAQAKWWHDADGYPIERNKGELIALMHSELSEALEAVRKGLMDDHLRHRSGEEAEMVDVLIRVFDYAGAYGLDLESVYREKMAYNASRADHMHEARADTHGKKF